MPTWAGVAWVCAVVAVMGIHLIFLFFLNYRTTCNQYTPGQGFRSEAENGQRSNRERGNLSHPRVRARRRERQSLKWRRGLGRIWLGSEVSHVERHGSAEACDAVCAI